MGQHTEISWTQRILPNGQIIGGATFNPWWGCNKVSEECFRCYAKDIAHHYKHEVWGPARKTERRLFGDRHWAEPLTWNRQAEQQGHRRNVFCASMADVFELHPMIDESRARLWKLIEATPWLNWLLLTKRPENIMTLAPWGKSAWPDNIWVGTSVGLQKRADERIPKLLEVPAVVRFLSCEPLLGPLDLSPWIDQLQWVICGGESGSGFRPLNLDWARTLRNQCQDANTPFFFKQHGGRTHNTGGRLLDGRTWDEMPAELPVRTR
jgi:protein gp37